MPRTLHTILRFNTVTLLVIVVAVSSCRNEKENNIKNASPYFAPLFLNNTETVFRNIHFNYSPEEVKKKETSKLYEVTPDHLFYEFTFPKDSTTFSEYANLQYFFNEDNQLDIITADIFLNDSIQESKLGNTLNTYYQQRFGDAETDDNSQYFWSGTADDPKTGDEYQYHVSLKEIPGEFGITVEYVRE